MGRFDNRFKVCVERALQHRHSGLSVPIAADKACEECGYDLSMTGFIMILVLHENQTSQWIAQLEEMDAMVKRSYERAKEKELGELSEEIPLTLAPAEPEYEQSEITGGQSYGDKWYHKLIEFGDTDIAKHIKI